MKDIIFLLLLVNVSCKSQDSSYQGATQPKRKPISKQEMQSPKPPEISKGAIRIKGTVEEIQENVVLFNLAEIVGVGPNFVGDLSSVEETVQLNNRQLRLKNTMNAVLKDNSEYVLEVLLNQENSSVGRILKLVGKANQ